MPYFDFHCHPGLKPTFSDQQTAISPWLFIDAKLAIFDIHIEINPLFNEVLNSQSCLSQLYNGDVKLFGIALHAPESNMARGLLEKNVVTRGGISVINRDRLELIKNGNHYFELLHEDLARLTGSHAPEELNGAKLKIIEHPEDYNETDPVTIYGFLIVEGLHCFFGDQTALNNTEVFTANFESFTDTNKVLAINVCHLQQNPFCNHAFGIQFIKEEYFFPTGNGITQWGHDMIKRMVEKKILVDIKHMSLLSRIQLYSQLRDQANPDKYVAPIICTHAGLTGQHFLDRVKYLLFTPENLGEVYKVCYLKPKSPHINGVYFNCSSINLYDEDVEFILLSGGLIGLSLDQRILGFADENVLRDVTIPNDVEYISTQEAGFFLGPEPAALPVWIDDDKIWTSEDFANLDPVFNIELHSLFFLNHVIHILSIAKNHPLIGIGKAMKQICFGTDYDGLINSIDNCKQADKMGVFKQFTLASMQKLLQDAGLGNEGIDVTVLVENLFYTNGRNFILNRLRETAG